MGHRALATTERYLHARPPTGAGGGGYGAFEPSVAGLSSPTASGALRTV